MGVILSRAIQAIFPTFPAGGMAFVTAICAALGVVWSAKTIIRRRGIQDNPVVLSRPIEILSLWFFGIVYGGILAGVFESYILSAITIVLSVLGVAAWHSHQSRRKGVGYYVYVSATLLGGMASLLLLAPYATSSL